MLSARALTSSSAAWRGCGRRLLPGCMAELLHGWRAALPWGRAALMRCGRTLTCVFEHFAQSRRSRPLPCRMAAVAAPFACHADATAPAPHFPLPPADAAAHSWRAGPSARERPISARFTLPAFASRCCLRCRRHPAQRIAPDLLSSSSAADGRRGAVWWAIRALLWPSSDEKRRETPLLSPQHARHASCRA